MLSTALLLLLAQAPDYQCGAYWVGGSHHDTFITAAGDTLSQVDKQGLYQGEHVYSSSQIRTTTTGYFKDGWPVGEWKVRFSDGSYAVGPCSIGAEEVVVTVTDIRKRQERGTYIKTGIWRCYTSAGQLVQTRRYEQRLDEKKKLLIRRAYVLVGDQGFVPSKEEEFSVKRNGDAPGYHVFRAAVTRDYYDTGRLQKFVRAEKNGRTIDYHPDGRVSSIERGRWYGGGIFPVYTGFTRHYSLAGQLSSVTRKIYLLFGLVNRQKHISYAEDGKKKSVRVRKFRATSVLK
ncbi:hypothetical protein EJV47_23460 [Hymenobacter gummosus]|uniref:Uncharacterized protein n=1 Tax=Hymenobacter gummosus TaxID=1776032 RepID=A0A431TWQ2_9BACT|nr:hypothetical protein [Hymenobacter gummosus]RTQ45797.1 hypothetical protein EJV47_23460 [Hymenobacter gummosus]